VDEGDEPEHDEDWAGRRRSAGAVRHHRPIPPASTRATRRIGLTAAAARRSLCVTRTRYSGVVVCGTARPCAGAPVRCGARL